MFERRRVGHLTLRQLEIFESVARVESVSRAAEALHLSQPGVSLQMKSLAEAIGKPLTEPVGRRIRLTQAGRDLAETCRELAAVWSRFESRLDDVEALRHGRLRMPRSRILRKNASCCANRVPGPAWRSTSALRVNAFHSLVE